MAPSTNYIDYTIYHFMYFTCFINNRIIRVCVYLLYARAEKIIVLFPVSHHHGHAPICPAFCVSVAFERTKCFSSVSIFMFSQSSQ